MKNNTWIITGTSTGFGKSLALFLVKQLGINLVATARNIDQLDYLNTFDQTHLLKLKLDVTNQEDIKNVVKKTMERFGSIDVLINNAGLGYFSTFEESQRESVRYMFDVNVWGLTDMTTAVLPIMRKQKDGVIANFSSVGGMVSYPTFSYYHGTKYAVEGISEALAQEVTGSNIKVLLVEPSGFRTDWAGRSSDKVVPQIEDYKQFTDYVVSTGANAHNEAGDPDKAAEIIYEQITNHKSELPLRLPLGQGSVDAAIAKYEQILVDFKNIYNLSRSADQPKK
ncbi:MULTISPECIES: oxidoreductase [unclassified Leuconostoc]|uniref:oxidoreductase n=1 Tax=unclassified Leuconostoc TaxID=2685106 RepID=UPI001906BACF|nr:MULTISPECIES: oxidoreductase [unclassified Leuconostoc]MBK0040913.1 SDR family NAD(P)-dependent oxidoreductase [Leuconostoc sp. S51]MBK0051462.1 SDR family NAD(P)-dependent oxidoreductase [Leuconostoc sp. S50]